MDSAQKKKDPDQKKITEKGKSRTFGSQPDLVEIVAAGGGERAAIDDVKRHGDSGREAISWTEDPELGGGADELIAGLRGR